MPTDERPMIHIRLPKPLLKEVDHEAVELELDRARTIERLLEKALDGKREAVGVR